MRGITTPTFLMLVLVSQFGLSTQTCAECTCCTNGASACDSNKTCTKGCTAGHFGAKCTEECLENCKTCVNGTGCTECIRGYYHNKCTLRCGKGCLDNTCVISSGHCTCKSSNFIKGKCDTCLQSRYGDECNNTCPTNCGSCISETECAWCQNNVYYGSNCQIRCSVGCDRGTCYKDTGNCIEGCKPGFSGVKCNKCLPGLYSKYCDLNCTENCFSCLSASNCTVCKSGFYGETCTKVCPSGCNGNCSLIDGKCNDCKPRFIGEFCNHTCKDGTYGGNCSKFCNDIDSYCQVCITGELGNYSGCMTCRSGHYPVISYGLNYSQCLKCSANCKDNMCNTAGLCKNGCLPGQWGGKCTKNCTNKCKECNQNDGKCLKCTKDGFHGNRCDSNCSNQCINTTCNQITAECLFGCIDGYEGSNCVSAIKGAESDEKKPLVVIAGSAGAGFAVIVLLVLLVICLLKRKRRGELSSNATCEVNECVLDMKEIHKQNEEDEPGVIYSKPFKPKQQPSYDAGKDYDTAYGDDKKIPAIDNGYAIVNIGTSANENNKTVEVCDTEHNNTCSKPTSGNNDYAVVNKGKSTVKEKDSIDEVYDTTHANKKSKTLLHSSNDYAVLNVRFDNTEGFGKSELTQPDDDYDFAEGRKHKTMPRPSNDYAVFNSNNGDKHGNDKANTLYDTATDKKMRPGNNDYDFCKLETD